ncbi:MAG: rhomboid protease GluP [Acidobacteriota bacterium]|nr:rhomboid protease GluP [Acidobacteriota bacterium]
MCRSCGALVGAGESSCSACDAPVVAVRDESARRNQPAYDPETMRFARAVLTRPATFTFVFVTFNVFVFLLMSFAVKGGGTEDPNVLMLFGAKYNSLINQGQWWRLITPVFIHIGWLHLIVNMYSLFMLGPYVERLYGSARFVFFWVATGIAGVAASYFASSIGGKPGVIGQFLFRGGDGPSAGASGALFGLVGVLFVFGLKYRHELPEGFKRAFGLGMLPTILINLFIGYTIPFIDNAAHLGGLAAGMLFALFVDYKRPGERGSVAFTWQALQIISLALIVAGFGEVARHFDTEQQHLRAVQQDVSRAQATENALIAAANAYIDATNSGQEAFAAALNKGDADAAGKALAKIDAARGLDEESSRILGELRTLVARAQAFATLDPRERATPRGQLTAKQLGDDFKAWEPRADNWVKTEGGKYNIVLSEDDKDKQSQATNEKDSTQKSK